SCAVTYYRLPFGGEAAFFQVDRTNSLQLLSSFAPRKTVLSRQPKATLGSNTFLAGCLIPPTLCLPWLSASVERSAARSWLE
ncbi:MAG: hypothetical protein ACREHD_26860, partial [Pirellulales bacterium]